MKKINSVLISVFDKQGLDVIARAFQKNDIKIYSTGGTYTYLESLNIDSVKVEDITDYPSIFDGRVKTLHPKIFGGILANRTVDSHKKDIEKYNIPLIDMVIVDLYPFEDTIKSTKNKEEIIEKIDIGGISLIRAAAKNFQDVLVVSSKNQYDEVLSYLEEHNYNTDCEMRMFYAKEAFHISSEYDSCIFNWFDNDKFSKLKVSISKNQYLRYGENPHQTAKFFGNLDDVFTKLSGKDISYNNLLDCDAAINLINDFDEPTIAIIKHTNACGVASRANLVDAWILALSSDPVSAFGSVIICNNVVTNELANKINKLFFEVLIAPSFSEEAMATLEQKKNRILLKLNNIPFSKHQIRTILNGVLFQERDSHIDSEIDFNYVTDLKPKAESVSDLLFAAKIVKHSKSNAIVLAKNNQMISSGIGQTSRVDALNQAIEKAKFFKLDLKDAVMASDAFFPFPDCVEIAAKNGISTIIQPGGSIRDNESIDACNKNNIAMVFTDKRHFKH